MGRAIGESLPIAIGVAISPMPIVAMVLMLVSARARANGIAFLVGWLCGVFGVGLVVVLVSGAVSPGSSSDPPAWVGWLKVVLGLLLLALAVRGWRQRPKGDQEPAPPAWMSAIDSFTAVKAFGTAFLLGGINPKNLLLVVSGATAIATATPSTGSRLVALLAFTIVASVGVAAPLVVYLAMGERAAAMLSSMQRWMVTNNAAIMAVLLLVLGTKLVGDGVSAL